ncbi:unnamed protein product [Coregonus sp. 'balchen']|nr:unnamed protein product [Coregonus sp. 'balchen']
MPENKATVCRTSSYLSHSAYRKIKRVLSFRRREYLRPTKRHTQSCSRGLLEVGLFRQPGQATLVKELQDAFDAGEKPSFDSSTDVHTVASLLKLYLRELPEPLVPFSRYQDFLMCGKKISSERKQSLIELRHLLHQLPVANFNLLNYICHVCLSVCPPGAAMVQQLMSELIRENQCLFSREGGDIEAPGSSRPDSYPCQRWKGDPFEGPHTQPTAQAQWHDSSLGITAEHLPQQQQAHHPSPCSRQVSLPLIAERRGSAQNPHETSLAARLSNTDHQRQPAEVFSPVSPVSGPLYHRYTPSQLESQPPETADSPHPASQLTASASTVTLHAAPEPSSMLHSGWMGPEDPSWAAEQGTTGTSGSSEAQDSTLSVYDNLDTLQRMEEMAADGGGGSPAGPVEVEVGMASVVDTRSSWSSCEILPLDDSGSGVVRASPGRGSTRFPSFRTDPGDEDLHPNSPASSSAPTDAPLSTGSSEVFLPSAPPDLHAPPASQAMHWLLAGLKQMARQRAEFEAKIQR